MKDTPASACPSPEALERAAGRGPLSDELASHLNRCAECRAAAREIAENLRFIAELRRTLGPEASMPPARTVPTDLSVPGYEFVREVGRGGQGAVYEAVQIATRRRVAVKIVELDSEGPRLARFEREVELAASLRHPGIVTVLHCHRLDARRHALVMEYVDGAPIDEWAAALDAASPPTAEGHRRAVRAKLRAAAGVCAALQHAHANGVIHRDLKPQNILVQADASVRLVDFGVARRTDGAALTRADGFAGTLAYAAPEQIAGGAERVDVRADLYALGVVLYELLTGRRPFRTDGPLADALNDIASAPPPPLGIIGPGRLPAGPNAEAVLAKALAKRPEDRYQSAAAMQSDVERLIAGEPVDARAPGVVTTLSTLARRHRVGFALSVAAVVLLATVAVGMTWVSRRLATQRTQLAEALSASTIERGRTVAAVGAIARAEELIWPELIAAAPSDRPLADSVFAGPPLAMQAAWALAEVYGRQRSLLHTPVPPDSAPVGFENDGRSVLVALPDGGLRSVRIDGGGSRDTSPPDPRPPDETVIATNRGYRVLRSGAGDTIAPVGGGAPAFIPRSTLGDRRVLDVSPDGRRALLALQGGPAELWSVDPPAALTELRPGRFVGNKPLFSADGRLVLWSDEGAVRAWRSDDGAPAGRWPIPAALWESSVVPSVWCVRTDRDGRTLAAAFHTGVLLFRADDPGAPPRQLLPHHRGFIAWIELTPDGSRLLSVGSDQTLRVWDTGDGRCLATFEHAGPIAGRAVLSDDGRLVALCEQRGTLRVFGVEPGAWRRRLDGPRNSVHRVRFSADGATLAAASSDGAVHAWSAADGAGAWTVSAPGASLSAVCFDPGGRWLAAADQGGRLLRMWLDDPERRLETLAEAPPFVTWIGSSPDGRTLAVLSGLPAVNLFDAATGVPAGRLGGGHGGHAARVIDAVFSRDGSTLYTVGADGALLAWNFAERTERYRAGPTGSPLRAVALSPDGRTLATGGDDRIIRLWDADTGRPLRTIRGSRQHVFELAFHSGGVVLFSCGRGHDVQAWDAGTGRELAVLPGHQDMVLSLAVSPDGTRLATASADRSVGLWDLTAPGAAIDANQAPWRADRYRTTGPEPGAPTGAGPSP